MKRCCFHGEERTHGTAQLFRTTHKDCSVLPVPTYGDRNRSTARSGTKEAIRCQALSATRSRAREAQRSERMHQRRSSSTPPSAPGRRERTSATTAMLMTARHGGACPSLSRCPHGMESNTAGKHPTRCGSISITQTISGQYYGIDASAPLIIYHAHPVQTGMTGRVTRGDAERPGHVSTQSVGTRALFLKTTDVEPAKRSFSWKEDFRG